MNVSRALLFVRRPRPYFGHPNRDDRAFWALAAFVSVLIIGCGLYAASHRDALISACKFPLTDVSCRLNPVHLKGTPLANLR